MGEQPFVSIVTANYNGASFLPAAARSIFAQTLADFEWIIADDASSDDSAAVIAHLSRGDRRIVFLEAERNRGPGGARNLALDVARGQWIAVFDSDDEMAPERLERLVSPEVAGGADIVVDNMTVFGTPDGKPEGPFLTGPCWNTPRTISLAEYIQRSRMYARRPGPGYLKPIIRREALGELRYREALRLGEDYDLVVRLLARGARMRFEPAPLYRYRRHGASISTVMRQGHIEQMLAADAHLELEYLAADAAPEVTRAQARRRRSLEAALAYDGVIQALKQRRFTAGISQSVRRPDVWPLLMMPIVARAKRLVPA